MKRIVCLVLALMLIFSLCACGGNGEKLDLKDYVLTYKDAILTNDFDGTDAIGITFDFKNNTKDAINAGWALSYNAYQNETDLTSAMVVTDSENGSVLDEYVWIDVEPGKTQEVCFTFMLEDTVTPVEMTFYCYDNGEEASITVDPATLERVPYESYGN